MKKTYIKPYICIEAFEVSEFIAGDCAIDVGFGDVGASKTCSILDPDFGEFGETLFNDYETCSLLWDDGTDKGCYHIPVNGHGYFGS